MIETKGVCHFTIAVTDTRKSTEFYTDVLGLKLLNANHERGMVFLDSAGDCVVLMKTDTTIAPVRQRDAHHAFHVDADKFDGCVQELRTRVSKSCLKMSARKAPLSPVAASISPTPMAM